MILDVTVCNDPQLVNILGIFKTIMKIATISIPVILTIFIMIDIIKTLASQDADTKKLSKSIIKRITAAVVIFLIPALLNMVLNLIPNGKFYYLDCYEMSNNYSEILRMTRETEGLLIDSLYCEGNKNKGVCCEKKNSCYNEAQKHYSDLKKWVNLIPENQEASENVISNYKSALEKYKKAIDSIK